MKNIIIVLLLTTSLNTFATEQIEEVLDLGGARFDIDELPLQSHPEHKAIVEKVGSGMCSASWRGYKGVWSISEGKLYLDFVVKDPCGDDSEYLYPAELLGVNGKQVVAKWYTGNITFRISHKTYFDSKTDGKSGEKYEAVVYKIRSGEVISRKIEQIEHVWGQ